MRHPTVEQRGTASVDVTLEIAPGGAPWWSQFLAQHAHQVSRMDVSVAPDEYPEARSLALAVRTAAEAPYPTSPTLMGRLLCIEAMRGAACGPGRERRELLGDRLPTGRPLLSAIA
ncbi:hypothetical protein Cme02nite_28550 [Catellatospora methionotrophica]|uniref:Uncharacterized protein n=1 Tax=Catellatospora methionotrophica TaxID=121620 RepID=A0A8J3PFM7_9ACTN|nr:hypothetical protein [Catellatospora methionotrophica]GIG14523.1 hypothetical protein Cme02nite_28550 [Catellatospora methionotrophica]